LRPCKGADWRDRHIKQYKAREKVTQKMTREGAVEVNAATGKKKRISKRIRDADFAKTEAPPQPEQAAQPLPGGATSPPLTDTPPLPHAPGAEREQDTAAAERVLERIDGARTRKASKKAARKAQAEATAKEKSSRLRFHVLRLDERHTWDFLHVGGQRPCGDGEQLRRKGKRASAAD